MREYAAPSLYGYKLPGCQRNLVAALARRELNMNLNNQLKGALGENIVINELLHNGWIALNLNAAVNNSPNVDITALKNELKINIQVKTASLSQPDVRVGHGQQDQFLNYKEGPLADFIVFIRVDSPKVYETYIVPVDIAEKEISRCYTSWFDRPKKDGTKRSHKFPSHIYFSPNKNRPDESNYREKWSHYLDAWHLLETPI